MKKLFFPLVAVVGLTAMSFTDVKAETREVKEVSMEELNESIDGSKWIQESIYRDFVKKNVYTTDQILNGVSKMENILNKY